MKKKKTKQKQGENKTNNHIEEMEQHKLSAMNLLIACGAEIVVIISNAQKETLDLFMPN